MRVTYLASHLKSAQNLYRQRAQLSAAPAAQAATLASLERRLRIHLWVLAQAGHTEAEPTEAPAAFVAFAAAVLRDDPELPAAAWALAAEDPSLLPAATEALALFPPAEPQRMFEALYQAQPPLRAALFDLARRLDLALPAALVSQAELQGEDAELTAAALRYAATRVGEFGTEVLRPYYRAPEAGGAAQLAALWGGLLRGDPEAASALAQAVDTVADDQRPEALRLLALAGAPDHLPILRQHAASAPAEGLALLGLFGQREVVADLLDGLARPESAEAAAAAWHWLFGTELPRKPRLEVIEAGSETPVPEAGALPDVAAARAHWEALQSTWQPGERWLAGRPLTVAQAAGVACTQAGLAARQALDLLAILSGGASQCDPQHWVELRQAQLKPLVTAKPAPPVEEGAHA